MQDVDGRSLPKFALDDCVLIYGAPIARVVTCKAGVALEAYLGNAARLRFVMEDADLFALQFVTQEGSKYSVNELRVGWKRGFAMLHPTQNG